MAFQREAGVRRRSFAGYLCEESLSVGLFGECFRAENKQGTRARVTVVDKRLSERKRFASALARYGSKLASLIHPNIVTTQKIGKGKDDVLVVIASSVEAPVELRALMESAGSLPNEIALSVAMGVLRGLSHAHEHQVVHGGVHPRSVLLDAQGVSKVSDFGLARALASAAASADNPELLLGLCGYVAPELALGHEPDQRCDVYAAGALISWLLWNQQAPPESEKDAVAAVLRTALDTNSQRRFPDATTFESELRAAIERCEGAIAAPSQVCRFLVESAEPFGAEPGSETDDLLPALELDASASQKRRPSAVLNEALAGLDGGFLGLEDNEDDDQGEVTVATFGSDGEATDYGDELTTVDADEPEAAQDPVEAIIFENTPQPTLLTSTKSRSRSKAAHLSDYDGTDQTPLPAPRPFHADGTHVGALVELVKRQAATSSPFDDDDALPIADARRSNTLRWLAVIAFVMAGLAAVAYTKSDRFGASKRDSEDRKNRALAAVEKMQPKPGQIAIVSDTEDAAVWVLLGRTPATSFLLPSSMVHELRIEHEGYRGLFISIAAQHWSGPESARSAIVSATLQPIEQPTQEPIEQPTEEGTTEEGTTEEGTTEEGTTEEGTTEEGTTEGTPENEVQVLPAFPPIADPPLTPGGAGQGPLRVESEPAGAEVWLWIGTTPTANLVGIEAGKNYEFKVLKDGHRPAFAAVKANDWYLSGEHGPTRPILERRVSLEALPETAKPEAAEAIEPAAEPESKGRRRRKDRK